ncbi:MAG: NUDIX hydrolase [Dehalococcoidia bacterium]
MSGARSERPIQRAVSAGGIVYRRNGNGVEVVLVMRPEGDGWALPKGTAEGGETLEQTALREVQEETGLEVVIVEAVGEDHYSFEPRRERVRIDKVVHHYLMEPRGGDFSLHDNEHPAVDWFDINEALRQLAFHSQRVILEQAAQLIDAREQAGGQR